MSRRTPTCPPRCAASSPDARSSGACGADALRIHSNTLRYRLDKYTSLTGADLTNTEVIIEVWWALEYWQVRRDRIGQGQHDRDPGP